MPLALANPAPRPPEEHPMLLAYLVYRMSRRASRTWGAAAPNRLLMAKLAANLFLLPVLGLDAVPVLVLLEVTVLFRLLYMAAFDPMASGG